MTKDKYKYIENLFRNYKKNKSRIKILNLGMVTDDDFTISAVDYSKDKIQTSSMSDLSDTIIKREKELEKYKAGTLPFEPSCDYEILYTQYIFMKHYQYTLEDRARIENIIL